MIIILLFYYYNNNYYFIIIIIIIVSIIIIYILNILINNYQMIFFTLPNSKKYKSSKNTLFYPCSKLFLNLPNEPYFFFFLAATGSARCQTVRAPIRAANESSSSEPGLAQSRLMKSLAQARLVTIRNNSQAGS
jgi:hypothetical protein